MLTDDGHREVRSVASAVLGGKRVAEMPGGVGSSSCLSEQRLPLRIRQSTALPIGPGVLATMIEEPDVVVGLLERDDLGLDEGVELVEIGAQVLG